MQRHHIRLAVTAAITIAVAACGTTSSTPSTSATAHFPVTITGTNGSSVTITRQPHRIVSLSPTATEMLFAIGAGGQVVAVDDQSNYPASAPMTKLSGYRPNIEAIASYTPDLVVAAHDTAGLVRGLGALNVPSLTRERWRLQYGLLSASFSRPPARTACRWPDRERRTTRSRRWRCC